MVTTRKVVNNQVEVTVTSTLIKNQVVVRIAALNSSIADLSTQIVDLQNQIDKLILLKDEWQSLNNQIV